MNISSGATALRISAKVQLGKSGEDVDTFADTDNGLLPYVTESPKVPNTARCSLAQSIEGKR